MKMLLYFLIFVLVSLNLQATDTLTIVHVNDTHSNLAPGGQRDSKLKGSLGGIARAATYIGLAKESYANVLTLHAGDIYVGDLFFQKYYGVAELQLMRAIGFDAMTVGNHEFDLTPSTLKTALDTAFANGKTFPLLSANLILDNDTVKGLKQYIQPYTIKTIGSLKVGIFGLTTPETNLLSLPAPAVIDTNIIPIATAMVQSLKLQKCDVIILLSHLGVALDQLVAQFVTGINLIVGGHDHYVLNSAIVVNRTPIVQAGAFYHSIGFVQLEINNGNVSLIASSVKTLDSTIHEEPTVAGAVEMLVADIESRYGPVYSIKIADADNDFHEVAENLTGNGNKDTEIGNLVTDAYRSIAKTDIAVQPGGSTAQMIYKGAIVPADAFRVVGYGFNMNDGLGFRMTTFSIKGAELMAGLEFGLSAIELNDEFLIQVSGIKYSYNPLASVGARLISVEINDKLIDPNATYSIATNEFVLGFFSIIGIQPTNIKVLGDTTEFAAFAGYLSAVQKVSAKVEGRILSNTISGIKEIKSITNNEVMVSPNPANTQTSVNFILEKSENVSLSVYSTDLREVIPSFNSSLQAGIQALSVDTKYLPSGAYIYKLSIGTRNIVGQIIVRK